MTTPHTPQAPQSSSTSLDTEERVLAEALCALPTPEPSAELDARILAMAKDALGVATPETSPSSTPVNLQTLRVHRRSRWGWGWGAAAAAALSALMFAPHWLDRSGVAPRFDAGRVAESLAPASPPSAELADRLQRAPPADVAKAVAPAASSTHASASVMAPARAEEAMAAPKPQRALPAGPAVVVPAPMAPPATVIAEQTTSPIEAVVVGEAQPEPAEHAAAADDQSLAETRARIERNDRQQQPEAFPVVDAAPSAASPTSAAPSPHQDATPVSEARTTSVGSVDPTLDRIRQLIAEQRTELALSGIADWTRQHPSQALPADIRAWWDKQQR
ncbi:MAG: hypothetical protein IT475_08495 [Aquimonas sp.]|nr:hypothetical protein [Aquimonas sp.]